MRIRRGKIVQDELTNSNLSRDRKWQLRNMAEGKCVHCGDRRDYKLPNGIISVRCLRCAKKYNKQKREKYARDHGL